MVQAADSAARLASTPRELLGPAGRTLQEIATNWAVVTHELTLVQPKETSTKRRSTAKRAEKSKGPQQLPLIPSVDHVRD
jgi:hypothetical protein